MIEIVEERRRNKEKRGIVKVEIVILDLIESKMMDKRIEEKKYKIMEREEDWLMDLIEGEMKKIKR